jgi:hypothetical protein
VGLSGDYVSGGLYCGWDFYCFEAESLVLTASSMVCPHNPRPRWQSNGDAEIAQSSHEPINVAITQAGVQAQPYE